MSQASPEELLAYHAGPVPHYDPAFKLFGRTIPVLPVSHRKRKWAEESSTDASAIVSADESYTRSTLQDMGGQSPESEDQSLGASVPDELGSSSASNDGDDEEKPNEATGKNSGVPAPDVPRVADLPIQGNDGEAIKSELDDEGTDVQDMSPKKPEKPVPCPRCDSLDTKFCYFNNYNVNQPRHFCKSCQRYWTAGGTLRNVPVGAGRRKSKHTASQHRNLPPDALVVRRDSADSAQHLLSCPRSSPVGLNRQLKMRPSPSSLHLQPVDVCSLTALDSPSSSTILNFGQESPLCESVGATSYSPQATEMLRGYRSEVTPGRPSGMNYASSEAGVVSSRPMEEDSSSPNEKQIQGQSCHFSSANDVSHEASASTPPASRPVLSVQAKMQPSLESKGRPVTMTDDQAITVDPSLGWNTGGPLAFVGASWQYGGSVGWGDTPLPSSMTAALSSNSNITSANPQTAAPVSHAPWGGPIGNLWGGIPWPYVQSPMWGPPLWGGAWTVPWAAAAAAATAVNPVRESPSPGKHNLEEGESTRSGKEGSLWVPKTLRIDDPGEAARSSIWMALGLDNRSESRTSGGIFSSLQKKAESEEVDNPAYARHSNPAAMTRSIAFQESNMVPSQKIDVQGM